MSAELPGPVARFVNQCVAARARVAYLGAGADGTLRTWGGELDHYGIGGTGRGATLVDVAPYLEGALPAGPDVVTLERVETRPSRYADIHLFAGDEHNWVVLFDRTDEASAQQLMQQHRNELILLRDRHSRLREQCLESRVAADLTDGLLNLDERGQTRAVTVMFADVRGSTGYAETARPEDVFDTVNLYLRIMIQPVLDEAGVVGTLVGDCIMAVFGLLPSPTAAARHSFRAATRMMDEVAWINRERTEAGQAILETGLGVATGMAVAGIMRSRRRRALNVFGAPMNLAARLERLAGRRELLMDETTFSGLGPVNRPLLRRVVGEGTSEETVYYVCTGKDP